MSRTTAIPAKLRTITLDGRRVKYTIRESATAKECRIRIGPAGVQVIAPQGAPKTRAQQFLRNNTSWVLGQVERVNCLPSAKSRSNNQLLLRGKKIRVLLDHDSQRGGGNLVVQDGNRIHVVSGGRGANPEKTLENWLRQQAREDIAAAIAKYSPRVRRSPNKVLIMGQRTKWGNCSSRGNLSFNWRLVMAPPFVLEYLVAHELTHLAVPDHSAKFWLTVRSLCPDVDVARKWLNDNSHQLINGRS